MQFGALCDSVKRNICRVPLDGRHLALPGDALRTQMWAAVESAGMAESILRGR